MAAATSRDFQLAVVEMGCLWFHVSGNSSGDFVCIDGIFVGCGDIVGSIDVVAIGLQMLPVIEFLQHR